jgi:hypothetical protein
MQIDRRRRRNRPAISDEFKIDHALRLPLPGCRSSLNGRNQCTRSDPPTGVRRNAVGASKSVTQRTIDADTNSGQPTMPAAAPDRSQPFVPVT